MAKLAIYLATFALVLFIANASITTVTVDSKEANPWGRQGRSEESCEAQIMKQDHLRDCQRYMKEQWGSMRRYNRPEKQLLNSCCEQLEKLNTQCRCPGLRFAAKQQMQQERMGREEMTEVAESIMSKCEMEPRRCDMPSRGMF